MPILLTCLKLSFLDSFQNEPAVGRMTNIVDRSRVLLCAFMVVMFVVNPLGLLADQSVFKQMNYAVHSGIGRTILSDGQRQFDIQYFHRIYRCDVEIPIYLIYAM